MSQSIDDNCYHVFLGPVGWEVVFDHEERHQHFDSEEAALRAARIAAEARWLHTKRPTCVGIGRPGRPIIIDTTYA